ncbi:MAG TPA: SDR family NAD(P)-dependent oxidoreductase [Actinomycetota bacterium]|nr:SDR family NAD(P)-dependent oxidoreductase [Actinomycetota bacterium]
MRIEGKTAVVTGGASGLGYATAAAFAEARASVAIVDLPRAGTGPGTGAGEEGPGTGAGGVGAGKQAAERLGERARFFPADVTSAAELAAALAGAEEAFGAIHVAVNCAGVATAGRILARDGSPLPLEQFEDVVRVNLVGSFNLLRLAAARMAGRPPEEGERGVVVLTASAAAFEGQIGQVAYAASKGGVASMTLTAARDLSGLGIRVVTIAPGTFDTPMLAMLPDEARQRLVADIPHPRRLGRPEEFAALVRCIVENPMLNGEVIRLDGALRMPPR